MINRFRPQTLLALTYTGGEFLARLVKADGTGPLHRFPLPGLLDAPRETGTALAEAFARAGLHERRCALCVPPSWALSASADHPDVSEEDLRDYLALRAEREFSATDLHLGHQTWTLPNGQRRATLAALSAKYFEAVQQCLSAAGLKLVSLSLALDDCRPAAAPVLHLLPRAEGSAIDAVLTAGGGCALLRTIDGSFARELRITLGRLPAELSPLVRNARILGLHSPELRSVLEQAGFESIVETAGDPGSAAVAAAKWWLQGKPVPFEFLPPPPSRLPVQIRRLERFNTPQGRRIAAIVAAVILLPFLIFLWRIYTENRLTAEWNGMKTSVTELETLQQKIRQFRPWFEPTPQKLPALRALLTASPEQGAVWMRSVQISADKSGDAVVNIAGFAQTNGALMAFQDSLRKQPGVSGVTLKNTRGNNPLQFSLTFKWQSQP